MVGLRKATHRAGKSGRPKAPRSAPSIARRLFLRRKKREDRGRNFLSGPQEGQDKTLDTPGRHARVVFPSTGYCTG
eukprot:1524790-Pyramimonas_sp.AAC.1